MKKTAVEDTLRFNDDGTLTDTEVAIQNLNNQKMWDEVGGACTAPRGTGAQHHGAPGHSATEHWGAAPQGAGVLYHGVSVYCTTGYRCTLPWVVVYCTTGNWCTVPWGTVVLYHGDSAL